MLSGLGVFSKAQSGNGKIVELPGDQAQVLVAERRKIEACIEACAARKAKEMQTIAKNKTKVR